jgi:hypothetical protein
MSPADITEAVGAPFSVSVCDLARLTGFANSRLITSGSREYGRGPEQASGC